MVLVILFVIAGYFILSAVGKQQVDSFIRDNVDVIPLKHVYKIRKNSSRSVANDNLAITYLRQLLTELPDSEVRQLANSLDKNRSLEFPRPVFAGKYSDQMKHIYSGITVTLYWNGKTKNAVNSVHFTGGNIRYYGKQKVLTKEQKAAQRKEASLLRRDVLERDKYTCQNCGLNIRKTPKIAHVDHIIPLSKGGLSTMTKLQVLCANCNMLKGTK